MIQDYANHACMMIAAMFRETAQLNPMPLYAIAAFVFLNMVLFYFTRGKEFVIGGFAATLFMVPFLNI